MDKFSYGGITFPLGGKPSFGDFKTTYEDFEDFKKIPHKSKLEQMKKIHKAYTKHSDQYLKENK